jgi:phosphoglucosamine mutase
VLHFGTDGIRGDAATQITPDLTRALARAFVRVTGTGRVLIARDGRASGTRIEDDLATGFAAEGAVCESAGLLPTPGLAVVSRVRDEWAAMISASHNTWSDNGIKFFQPGGSKLSDEHQDAIEAELQALLAAGGPPAKAAHALPLTGARAIYEAHLVDQLAEGALGGAKVVLDCANGAASEVAPEVFSEAGAQTVVLHASPDGRNINDACGSTFPGAMQRAVVEHGATLGLAFDGDADRVLAADERGELVDGDQIMAIMAIALREQAALPHDAIAVTVMSNLGLRLGLRDHGIDLVETPVGDRHVVAAMHERGLALGGEQSGHIVFGGRAATGDGILTGMLLAARVIDSGRPLSRLAAVMTRLPQVLVNVRVATSGDPEDDAHVRAVVDQTVADLGETGRVLVRASGTEPVVRVMVEAATESEAHAAANRIAEVIAKPPSADLPTTPGET